MKKTIYFLGFILVFFSCSDTTVIETETEVTQESEWINIDPPYPTGGTGTFPLMKEPIYKSVKDFDNLKDDDKVAIVSYHGKIKVYPYLYNNRYEIVNDSIGAYFYAVSYCPQTKSAINFNRIVQNDTLDLVASGYLYKDNMVPSDKNYTQFWSQMLLKGINTKADDRNLQTLNLIQTKWKTIVDFFPDAKVFYYEGDIITPKKNPVSPLQKTQNQVLNSDDVFSIIEHMNNDAKPTTVHAYPIKNFSNQTSLEEINIDGLRTLILGNKEHYFFTTLTIPTGLPFHLENINFPPILVDNEGTKWNAFGYAFEGPRKGQQLSSVKSYIASWWAWKDFFKNITLK